MDLGLDDRGAFVTGGAQGIGRAIVERLLAEGARVAFADIDETEARAAIAAIGAGERVRFLSRCDVSLRGRRCRRRSAMPLHISAAWTCS